MTQINRRFLLGWFSAVAMTCVLGCGQAPNNVDQQTAKPEKERLLDAAESQPPQQERQLTVAAASDLKFALDEIIAEFQAAHPEITLKATYGSSGNFFAQISNDAPFDIFLSADMQYARDLAEQGKGAKDSVFPYALGYIVVWVPKQSELDLEQLGIRAVVDGRVKKVAIANPKHAPYGRAAEAAMKSLGVYDQASERLVLGENIAQTTQFVESGAADVGIIALSLATAPALKDKGRYWQIPSDAYPPLLQGGVILNRCEHPAAAKGFRDFLIGEEGRRTLQKYGFGLPGE